MPDADCKKDEVAVTFGAPYADLVEQQPFSVPIACAETVDDMMDYLADNVPSVQNFLKNPTHRKWTVVLVDGERLDDSEALKSGEEVYIVAPAIAG